MTERPEMLSDDVRPIPRRVALGIAAAFVTLITLPVVYHARYALHADDLARWGGYFRGAPSAAAVRAAEADFDRRFVLGTLARTLASRVPGEVLRPKFSDDVVGPDGWLFPGADVQVCNSAGFYARPSAATVRSADAALADLARQLRGRGIHLLVVPVPSKASIYPEHVARREAPAGPDLNLHHARWVEGLRAADVDVLDLTDAFWAARYGDGGPLFHPTDSHWSPRGMGLAAAEIARRLRPRVAGLPPAQPFEFRTFRRSFVGDLRPTTGRAGEEDKPDVQEECRQLYREGSGPVVPGNEAPLLVIGDSFAARLVEQGCGVGQQVMAELNVPAQTAAVVGGHSGDMRRRLNSPGILTNKRVVIFVFAIRQISYGGEWVPFKLAP